MPIGSSFVGPGRCGDGAGPHGSCDRADSQCAAQLNEDQLFAQKYSLALSDVLLTGHWRAPFPSTLLQLRA